MLKKYQKFWPHIAIWILMMIFFAIAPGLRAQFFLVNGKPSQTDETLPQEKKRGEYAISGVDPTIYEGEDLYKLWGWAFLYKNLDTPPDKYERVIVLRSNTKIYFFPVITVLSPDVQTVFKEVDTDLSKASFYSIISKDVLSIGEYEIGILFKHRASNSSYYLKTNKKVVRTPNQLLLIRE